MSDRNFTEITADIDALIADPLHEPAVVSARESLARADRKSAKAARHRWAPRP